MGIKKQFWHKLLLCSTYTLYPCKKMVAILSRQSIYTEIFHCFSCAVQKNAFVCETYVFSYDFVHELNKPAKLHDYFSVINISEIVEVTSFA